MKTTLTAAALVAALGLPAFAQGTGASGYFDLYNDTTANTVVGFYTNDGSGWSTNWLGGTALDPGEYVTVEFSAGSGPCEQSLIVGWLGASGGEVRDDPIAIDICDASNLYLGDNDIAYD